MTDGAVAVAPPQLSDELYYCHQCKTEIHPTLPDYACPQCSGGFVEPVQDSHRSGTGRLQGTGLFGVNMDSYGDDDESEYLDDAMSDDDDDDATSMQQQMAYQDFSRLLRTLIRGMPGGLDGDDMSPRRGGPGRRGGRGDREERNSRGDREARRSESGSLASTPGASTQNIASSPPGGDSAMPSEVPDNDAAAAAQAAAAASSETVGASSNPPHQPRQRRNRATGGGQRRRRRNFGGGGGFLPLEDILEQMFTGPLVGHGGPSMAFGGGMGGGSGPGGLFFAGNPGDYAFGPRGLDDIITQLLNQYEGGGAPAAKEEEITQLPTDKITEKEVAGAAQCPVCFDDYELGQEVKRLACKHAFHEGCITPWLKIHGTCPVCRSDLQGNAPESPTPKGEAGTPSDPTSASSLFNFDLPGPSGSQQSRPPAQASQRPSQQRGSSNSSNPNSFAFRTAAFRPTGFGTFYASPNAGGGLHHHRQPRSSNNNNNQNTNRTSSNPGSDGSGNNNNNNNNNNGASGGASSNSRSSSSYLDQVD